MNYNLNCFKAILLFLYIFFQANPAFSQNINGFNIYVGPDAPAFIIFKDEVKSFEFNQTDGYKFYNIIRRSGNAVSIAYRRNSTEEKPEKQSAVIIEGKRTHMIEITFQPDYDINKDKQLLYDYSDLKELRNLIAQHKAQANETLLADASHKTTAAEENEALEIERLKMEKEQEERRRQQELERRAQMEVEKKRLAQQEAVEKEKLTQQEQARKEAEREAAAAKKEQERLAKKRAEQEKQAKEAAEKEKIAREQEEAARRKALQAEQQEKTRKEQELLAKQRAEKKQMSDEAAEKEKIAREQEEEARRKAQQAKQEEKARKEQERLARERAEKERMAEEAAEKEKIAREQEEEARRKAEEAAEAARIAAQQTREKQEQIEDDKKYSLVGLWQRYGSKGVDIYEIPPAQYKLNNADFFLDSDTLRNYQVARRLIDAEQPAAYDITSNMVKDVQVTLKNIHFEKGNVYYELFVENNSDQDFLQGPIGMYWYLEDASFYKWLSCSYYTYISGVNLVKPKSTGKIVFVTRLADVLTDDKLMLTLSDRRWPDQQMQIQISGADYNKELDKTAVDEGKKTAE